MSLLHTERSARADDQSFWLWGQDGINLQRGERGGENVSDGKHSGQSDMGKAEQLVQGSTIRGLGIPATCPHWYRVGKRAFIWRD